MDRKKGEETDFCYLLQKAISLMSYSTFNHFAISHYTVTVLI